MAIQAIQMITLRQPSPGIAFDFFFRKILLLQCLYWKLFLQLLLLWLHYNLNECEEHPSVCMSRKTSISWINYLEKQNIVFLKKRTKITEALRNNRRNVLDITGKWRKYLWMHRCLGFLPYIRSLWSITDLIKMYKVFKLVLILLLSLTIDPHSAI